MIKLISKFCMISNAKFPDLSLGVYMRIRKKKDQAIFQVVFGKYKLWNTMTRSFCIGT